MALIDRDRLVCIGRVIDAHGLAGDLKVRPVTTTPSYYESSAAVIVDTGHGLQSHAVRHLRSAGALWVMGLEGVSSREAALALKGSEVLLSEDDVRPLEEGEYFLDDLIGCTVEDLDGTTLGQVRGVIETGANDVLEVTTETGEVLVPVTDEVVRQVDIDGRRICIAPLPGLFDEDG